MSRIFRATRRTVAAVAVLAGAAIGANAQSITMATGQQGGSWYPVGGASRQLSNASFRMSA
ncbi:hypothetical protein [Paracoccus methylarcula]|uniref:hypothetical protein n=1 Tax=Paracoccus methylarcula TaxID=72022 RepID=UPI001FE71927|nr:hypothetical protein [Paracoccus methylarcula]